MAPHYFVKVCTRKVYNLSSLHLADDFPVFLRPLTGLRITCGRDRLPTLLAATSFTLSALLPALKGRRGDGDHSSFAPASFLARPAIQLCPSTAFQMALPHGSLPIQVSGGTNVSQVGWSDLV